MSPPPPFSNFHIHHLLSQPSFTFESASSPPFPPPSPPPSPPPPELHACDRLFPPSLNNLPQKIVLNAFKIVVSYFACSMLFISCESTVKMRLFPRGPSLPYTTAGKPPDGADFWQIKH